MKESQPEGLYEKPKYAYPIHDINWTGGLGQPAGIYWLGGRSVIAAHGSAAEDRLLDLGAILMATLRFDGGVYERSFADRPVSPVGARHLVLQPT